MKFCVSFKRISCNMRFNFQTNLLIFVHFITFIDILTCVQNHLVSPVMMLHFYFGCFVSCFAVLFKNK